MKGYYPKQDEYTSKPTNIIPFASVNTSSSADPNLESLIFEGLSNPEIKKHLKGIIEGAIMDAYIKTHMSKFEGIDDPFDAIYISELKADEVQKQDIERIMKYSKITDLSHTLTFDDEWND